ncbi:DivIVA domain-containing protein [Phytohabitans sp. ZYX-F-186]|uniref:DivIVA domain-containing protein n=1 Tax=Phytohabitans maris TaxID=3071409 RepID=A0ABU0ZIA9_9ACTN|nr:DivIVA domain-containing protein [Phytohabitans sp. ZYX-F-186]MDQ7906762.1 DivIVA domain-containing protein [Phytohabitans sp. ZYX-F-186]
MGQVLLLVVVALTVAAVVFGVTVLVTGGDSGLGTAEPDGRAVPLPGTRPLVEADVSAVRFDTTVRGYRMAQVDQALRRAAYDIGYKDELIGVLEAEVTALREGRASDADTLRRAREAALVPAGAGVGGGYGGTTPGLVDLGDVSAPREGGDGEERDAEGAATAVPGPVLAAGAAVTADEVLGDDTDDEVDTDAADSEASGSVEGEAGAADEAGDEPDDATDSDARRTLPDRDERA